MSLSSRLVLAAATVTAAAGAIAAGPPETGFDRPGGVYSNIPTKDAAACAIACAQDRICMSWTFRLTEFVGCSLKAVVPASVPDRQATSGIAERADDFLSLVSIAPPAATPSVEAAPPPVANLAAAKSQLEPGPPAKTAAAPESTDSAPELLGAPASLSETIGDIAPATFKPIALTLGALADPRPILEIAAPASLQTTTRLSAPLLRATIQQRAPAFETAALVLPPEPEPLVAPALLTARLTNVTRIAYRAPPNLIGPAPLFTPIVAIEAPAAAQRANLVTTAAAPRALQSPRPAINDHVVLALPPMQQTEQPSPNVQPAAYAAIDQAVLTQTSAAAPVEEELLGAP